MREIHLVPFRHVIRNYACQSLMMAYSDFLGVPVAKSKELLRNILREEWGFDGFVMTDWFATGRKYGNSAHAIASGNDLIMPGSEKDDADIRQAYADGRLSEKEIRLCAGRIISLINKLDKKTKK